MPIGARFSSSKKALQKMQGFFYEQAKAACQENFSILGSKKAENGG